MLLWKDLVQDIIVDESLQSAPKVTNGTLAENNEGAQKRKATAQNGPVGQTPNSAERKPKERRQRTFEQADDDYFNPRNNAPNTDKNQSGANEPAKDDLTEALATM